MADLLGAWYRDAVGAVLRRTGPIPRHVAFIMDGNRRYARQRGLAAAVDGGPLLPTSSSSSRVVEGHRAGYSAMVDAVGWCLSLGVTHVTLYAFSLDNYARAPQEVADLMDLAAAKYGELARDEGFKGGGGGGGGKNKGKGSVAAAKEDEEEAQEVAGGEVAEDSSRSRRRRRSRSCGGKARCGSGGRRQRRRRRQEEEEAAKQQQQQQPAIQAPVAKTPPPSSYHTPTPTTKTSTNTSSSSSSSSWRGAEVRILGNLDTAPTAVRQAAARLMRATRAYGIGEDEEDEDEGSQEEEEEDESSDYSSSGEEEEEEGAAKTAEEPQQPSDDQDEDEDGFDARAEALMHGEPGPLPASRLNSPLGSARYDSSARSSPSASASPLPLLPSPAGGRYNRPHQKPPPQRRRRRRRPPVVNICFAYTSTDELRSAVNDVRSALKRLQLLPGDVDARLLLASMHTRECPPVDLVLRTSGEQRLSDFVVWQASCAQVQVLPCLWPEITFARLARCVAAYQRHAKGLAALRAAVAQGGGAPVVVEQRGGGKDDDDEEDDDEEEEGGGYHALGLPMTASLLEEGGGGGGGGGAAAAAAPGGGPPQRTASILSSISEDEPTLAPHPHVALRVAGFLRSLDARRGAWVARHTK